MSEPSTFQLVAAGAYVLPALIWAIVAQDGWRALRAHGAPNQLSTLLPIISTCIGGFYALGMLLTLVPDDLHNHPTPPLLVLYFASDIMLISSVAMFHHMAQLFPLRAPSPRRLWLIANYAPAVALISLSAHLSWLPGATQQERVGTFQMLLFAYILSALALSLWQISRYARRGLWRPGGLGEARYADVVMLSAGLLGLAVLFVAGIKAPLTWGTPHWVSLANVGIGILLALPFAARIFGEVVRRLIATAATIAGVAVIVLALRWAEGAIDQPALRPAFAIATLLLPVLVLVRVQAPLHAAIDHLLFRRGRWRRERLSAALLALAPQRGIEECCRRALAEIAAVMQLRGAALLLERDRQVIAHGRLDLEPLRRVWPSGRAADALPAQTFAAGTFRNLPGPLQEALVEADIVGVVPIVSPRQRWGYCFVTTGALNASFSDDDVRAVQSFADQFALVLDAAELLDRAVAVERSLAHAETLAAIGEMAARIAHEIRNPITAARSLAQQLARESAAPFAAEHALILAELERVEQQVRALLRFSRRDEFRFAPTDLGGLVRATVDALRPRLAQADIAVAVDARDGIVLTADGEKIRQVLINLIENAADALAAQPAARSIAIAVQAENGSGALRVEDNGGGIPPDALARVFEPFFSLKPSGTGLGLAIAKRIVDAHRGELSVAAGARGGTVVTMRLPAPPAELRSHA